MNDLEQLEPPPQGFAIEVVDDRLRVTQRGNFQDDIEPVPTGDAQLLAAVADATQYLVSYGVGDPVWPVCSTHDFGLHAEIRTGDAVWICRPHDHVVARIGHLTD